MGERKQIINKWKMDIGKRGQSILNYFMNFEKITDGKKCDINFWSNMIILHVEKVVDYMNA